VGGASYMAHDSRLADSAVIPLRESE